jgi:hypothetical protein
MMRRLLIVLISAATFAPAGAAWELVASFRSPITDPHGYAADSMQSGWINSGGSVPYVNRVHLGTGSIMSSFPAPGGAGASGVANRSGFILYISNNRTSWIYEVTETGSLYSSFPCPVPGPADLDVDEGLHYLYIAIPARNIIAVVNPTTGSLLSSFAGPGSRPTGCCGYGMTLIADSATHIIYENGRPVITGIQTPVGIDDAHTLGQDIGYFMWVVDAATGYIYRYDNWVGTDPASLGRVKALFE